MNQINLSELDFDNIRTSLVQYLKKQDTVRDLNFEGSAVNFLLDLLAYNTLYYAHFANMISGEAFLDSAQLERSIVALVKPLGYVLPTKTSAKARIKLTNVLTSSVLEPFSINVVGFTPEGTQYQFWNIEHINVSSTNQTDYFSVYEGTYTLLTYGGNGFDFPNQEILIPDLNLDVKTIKVSVKRAAEGIDAPYRYWSLLDTYSGFFAEPTSNLYSIERKLGGFNIKFQTSGSQDLILVAGDKVKIEYLSSSGSNANTAASFKAVSIPAGSIVTTVKPASGGLNQPNLDEAKKIAPLIFSSQQRLVTKSDYIGFLAQLGYLNGINVWGGEDNTPPIYGRLLFSINGIASTDNSEIRDIITRIKERSVVTILPEYVPPLSMIVNARLMTSYNANILTNNPSDLLDDVIDELNSIYTSGAFNTSLQVSTIKEKVEQYEGLYFEDLTDIKLEYSMLPSSSNVTMNFKNAIYKTSTTNSGNGVYSSEFISPYYETEKVQIRDVPIVFPENSINAPSIGKLKLYAKNADGVYDIDLNSIVGEVNYKQGSVTIYPDLSTELVKVYAVPQSNTTVLSKDEVYLTLNIQKLPSEIV